MKTILSMKVTNIILILLFLALPLESQAQQFNYKGDAQKSVLKSEIQSHDYEGEPGFSLILIKDDEILYTQNAGLENINETDKIDEHTPFNIASISKTFTAAAILKLKEEELLDLERPVSEYLSDIPKYASEVSVYHLLTHTSGLPDYERIPGDNSWDNQRAVAPLYEKNRLAFPSGSDYSYSNLSYVLLARIIESVSGKTYSEYLKEHFFEPLGMQNTYVAGSSKMRLKRAIGYRFDETTSRFITDDSANDQSYGATGIYSSTADLAKWYLALKEQKILSPSSIALMYHYPVTTSGKFSWMAMGWFNESIGRHTPELQGLKKRGAIGDSYGFRSMMEMYENHDFGYIFLTNRGDFLPFISTEMAKIFFEQENTGN